MIKTKDCIISQAVNGQEISILKDGELYTLNAQDLEAFILEQIENKKAEKFEL